MTKIKETLRSIFFMKMTDFLNFLCFSYDSHLCPFVANKYKIKYAKHKIINPL
jgi:hypothetical protein